MISEGSCDTEDWVMKLKIQRCITEINSILKYIKIGKTILEIAIRFHNITVFSVFLIE